jgi:sugar phosphate isomerase/epimerase
MTTNGTTPGDMAAVGRPRVLASTTSHKREPLAATLEVFSRLDLRDIDLNLHHIIKEGVSVDFAAECVARWDVRLWVVSGGWCDFFDSAPRVNDTFQSVSRQVAIAHRLGVFQLRLFFGHLRYEDYSQRYRQVICDNLSRLSAEHPDMLFTFENHDGASLHPEICREILEQVDRANIRMNFDPINFERAGVNSLAALDMVRPFVAHVHLKGLAGGEFCEFGAGDIDLNPILRSLIARGYGGGLSVEYEGRQDGTLRLYQAVQRARSTLHALDGILDSGR